MKSDTQIVDEATEIGLEMARKLNSKDFVHWLNRCYELSVSDPSSQERASKYWAIIAKRISKCDIVSV